MKTGIEYEDARTYVGLVAEMEERQAARTSGYTWPEYMAAEYDSRVTAVAFMRLTQIIELHSQDAVEKAQDRERRKQRK